MVNDPAATHNCYWLLTVIATFDLTSAPDLGDRRVRLERLGDGGGALGLYIVAVKAVSGSETDVS